MTDKEYTRAFSFQVINAQAASINSGQTFIYPESFLIAALSTGENSIVQALKNQKINFESLIKKTRSELKSKSEQDSTTSESTPDIGISFEIKEIFNSLNQSLDKEKIDIPDFFVEMLNKCKNIVNILNEMSVDIKRFKEDILKNNKLAKKPIKPVLQSTPNDVLSICIDLTEMAKNGKLEPVIAREKEIDEAITILCRKNKRNPILIGPPGTGKSAIVDGIAQRIIASTVPDRLKNCKIFSLNMTNLVAGTKYRGDFEAKIQGIIKEFENNAQYILFVDEIHTIVGAGGSDKSSSMDAANMLKPALARGMRCIGATTLGEYKKHIMHDAALDRRFEKISINEPNLEHTKKILEGVKPSLEDYHKCKIPNDVISYAIRMADRYLTTTYFPDKAIDCLDTACAKYSWKNDKNKEITNDDVAHVISQKTTIPVEVLLMDNQDKISKMENSLRINIFGQEEAIKNITKHLKMSFVGIRNANRPLAVWLFAGQPSTGKTMTAQILAKEIFSKNNSILKIDMSEYSEAHSISKFIGSPPGYSGFNDHEPEIEKIRRNPYSMIIFEGIDKASFSMLKLLNQIIKEGEINDSQGNKVNCKNLIIVFTLTTSSQDVKAASIGFGDASKSLIEVEKEKILKYSTSFLGEDFVNQIDEFIIFEPLQKESMMKIIEKELDSIKNIINTKTINLVFSPSVADYIMEIKEKEHGQNVLQIKRTISKNLEPCLAEAILSIKNPEKTKNTINISAENSILKIDIIKATKK